MLIWKIFLIKKYLIALELRSQLSESIVDGNMKLIAVRVSNEDVSLIGNIDSIRKIGVWSGTNSTDELSAFVNYYNAMAFEIANVVMIAENRDVRRFAHVIGTFYKKKKEKKLKIGRKAFFCVIVSPI